MAGEGMTLKQMARRRFWSALSNYKAALISGNPEAIVRTSLVIHAAKAGVPKSWWPLVNRTLREVTSN